MLLPLKFKKRLYCFLIVLISVFISCNNKQEKKSEAPIIATDTTEVGKAVVTISEKINAEPNNAGLYSQRSKLYILQQNFQNALDDINKAISIDSTHADYYLTLSDLYFTANKTFNAKAALEKCLTLDPKNTTAHLKLAEIFFIVRKYEEAFSHLQSILQNEPDNTKAFFMRGMIYKENGDTTKAISNFQTCIEKDNNFYDAYMQLGVIYTAKNDKLALQYFNGAIKIKPQSEEAFYGRGLFYQDHNELDKAIRDYTSIIQFNPKSARAHFNLGYIHYAFLKVYGQAIKHYSDAIAANENYAEAWYNRGLCYEAVGNIAAAKDDYDKAISIRPGYELAMQGLERLKK
ncbi:MAG: tetratricopeptide repeat protein [Bacteroidia bacterium]